MISGAAALRAQTVALLRGPRKERVVWDIPRERLDTEQEAPERASPQDR